LKKRVKNEGKKGILKKKVIFVVLLYLINLLFVVCFSP